MNKNDDVKHVSNFDKILNPDLTLDEKMMYYLDLLEEATIKDDVKLQKEIIEIIDELNARGDNAHD